MIKFTAVSKRDVSVGVFVTSLGVKLLTYLRNIPIYHSAKAFYRKYPPKSSTKFYVVSLAANTDLEIPTI